MKSARSNLIGVKNILWRFEISYGNNETLKSSRRFTTCYKSLVFTSNIYLVIGGISLYALFSHYFHPSKNWLLNHKTNCYIVLSLSLIKLFVQSVVKTKFLLVRHKYAHNPIYASKLWSLISKIARLKNYLATYFQVYTLSDYSWI